MSVLVNVVNVFVDADGAHGNPLGIVWASNSTKGREEEISADLGFSETVFIDELTDTEVRARIFTSMQELPFAGHPVVGLAGWLVASGDDIHTVTVPAGVCRVRVDGDRVYVNAMVDWAPDFTLEELPSPEDVELVDPEAYGMGMHYVWAWSDRDEHRIRARMFAPELGIREDEATGAGAMRLTTALGCDLKIRQGEGSELFTHMRYVGQQIEVGGRVSEARLTEIL